MPHVFSLPERPHAAIEGTSDTFPVRRIICIGRNYEAHAREMGVSIDREAPFFFTSRVDGAAPASKGGAGNGPGGICALDGG